MASTIFETIGTNIQKARKQKGWTLERLSSECNIAASNLSNYEGGSKMTISTLEKIVVALGVSYDYIFSHSGILLLKDEKHDLSLDKIVSSIEYLTIHGVFERVRINENCYFSSCEDDHSVPYINSSVLEASRNLAGSSPYNAVTIRYPSCIPVLRYVTNIQNNIRLVDDADREEFINIQNKMLKKEIKGILKEST